MYLRRFTTGLGYLFFALLLAGVAFVIPILLNFETSALETSEASLPEQFEKAAGLPPLIEVSDHEVRIWIAFVWPSSDALGEGFVIGVSRTTRYRVVSGADNLRRYAVNPISHSESDNSNLLLELQNEMERNDGVRWHCANDAQDYNFESVRDGVLRKTSFQYICDETPAVFKRVLDELYATPQLAL
jgi:hypothetical protein